MKRTLSQRTTYYESPFDETSRTDCKGQTNSWLGVGGLWAEMEVTAYGHSFFFWDDENDPKLTVVIVAHSVNTKKPIKLHNLNGWFV